SARGWPSRSPGWPSTAAEPAWPPLGRLALALALDTMPLGALDTMGAYAAKRSTQTGMHSHGRPYAAQVRSGRPGECITCEPAGAAPRERRRDYPVGGGYPAGGGYPQAAGAGLLAVGLACGFAVIRVIRIVRAVAVLHGEGEAVRVGRP